jgi:hypothetical protein
VRCLSLGRCLMTRSLLNAQIRFFHAFCDKDHDSDKEVN